MDGGRQTQCKRRGCGAVCGVVAIGTAAFFFVLGFASRGAAPVAGAAILAAVAAATLIIATAVLCVGARLGAEDDEEARAEAEISAILANFRTRPPATRPRPIPGWGEVVG
jgi:hypothetical protein